MTKKSKIIPVPTVFLLRHYQSNNHQKIVRPKEYCRHRCNFRFFTRRSTLTITTSESKIITLASFNNLVSITTDGVPAMIDSKLGLTTLWPEEVPHLLSFHCIIHQEALCAQISNDRLLSVMTTVTVIVILFEQKH